MTARFDVEQRLTAWLEEAGAPMVPDYLDEVVQRARHIRQRPAWLSPWRWLPMDLTMRTAVVPRSVWLLVIIGVVLGLLVGLAVVGSQRHLPPPFGLAKTGLVVVDSQGDLVVADADGTGRRAITTGPALDLAPMWSPDGTKIAYYSRASANATTSSLVVADADGQHPVVLDSAVRNVTWPSLSWAPDSRHVAYMGDLGAAGQFTPNAGRIFVADLEARTSGPIARDIVAGSDPAWSPDGRTIAFTWATPDGVGQALYLMNADGSNAHQISAGLGDSAAYGVPQWSPDGTEILVYGGYYPHDIFVIDAVGGGQRNLTKSLADEFYPTWSNAGTQIAYRVGTTDPNVDEVHVMNADGSGDRALATPELTGSPVYWSPDDKRLFAYDSAHANIVILTVDGSRPPVLIAAPGNYLTGNWQRLAP